MTHQTAVDLNVGSIKVPTSYEVRSAIARARQGQGGTESITQTYISAPQTNHINMVVYVDSKSDPRLKSVTDAMTKAINQVNGQISAVGIP